MKRRLRIPLRVKFLGALLLLVTAVVSVITFTMANMFHQDKSAYVSDLVSVVAMSTADECRSVVEGYREKLLSYSRILRDPGIANERKKILVGGYFGDSPELLALYLHADGRIQASAHDEAGLRAAGLRKADLDEELGRQGLPMDRVLAGEILVRNGSIPGKLRCLTMALAAPTEEGLGPAAVVGVLRLDSLQRLAERSEVFDVAVSDGSGTLLAHRDASLVESRAALAIDPSALDLVRTANAAVTTRYEGEGSDMVGGVTAVGIGGLTVSAGLPAAVAYLASRSLLTRLVGVSLLVLVIVALAAEFWARRITRPVDLLSAAAREVGKGRFETKVDVDSGDEIGTLADSFNRMSDELHKRDAALGEAQAQLVQSEKMAAFGLLGAGIAHETRSHRTALDLALTADAITVALDQGRAEAALEQGAGSPISAVDVLDVAEAEALHQAARPALGRRCDEEMDVVGHQCIGMHRYPLSGSSLTQRSEEGSSIRLGEEDGRPVDPAHDHMQGVAGNNDSGVSCHCGAATRRGNLWSV
mgnify:CR=1 FL=1